MILKSETSQIIHQNWKTGEIGFEVDIIARLKEFPRKRLSCPRRHLKKLFIVGHQRNTFLLLKLFLQL